ncbi:helix-turn-helix domain-containing protein, partial [Streptomyces sp. SID625]|nr:helix-turn-helix domain-containing protein [Streptomyces sp. SID625]
MDQRPELGTFLRSRRARLRPEDIGLVTYGGRRRVPGLRREELAQLAGVSVGYYTRLEQGQSPNASDAVLD